MTARHDDASIEPSSPACAMHEADDAYMGYAAKAELLAFLNAMLEAERAGGRVARRSVGAADGAMAGLLRTIEKNAARWCAMLTHHITALGGTPSLAVCAFHDEAMAIKDVDERAVVLMREYGWIVRKLDEILPRVRADRLHAGLREMRAAHGAIVACAGEVLGRGAARADQG